MPRSPKISTEPTAEVAQPTAPPAPAVVPAVAPIDPAPAASPSESAASPPGPTMRESLRQAAPVLRTGARWLLVLLALYVVGWLLWNALPAMTPFIIGLVLAFLMLPIVNRLARKMPRWLAILTVYVGGIVVLVVAGDYVIPLVSAQVQQLFDNFPTVDQLQELGNSLLARYHDQVPAVLQQPIDNGVRNAIQVAQANATGYLQQLGTFVLNQAIQIINTVTFLIGFLIIPIWLFYVLNDQAQGRAFVDQSLHPRLRADFWNVWEIISEVLNDYRYWYGEWTTPILCNANHADVRIG